MSVILATTGVIAAMLGTATPALAATAPSAPQMLDAYSTDPISGQLIDGGASVQWWAPTSDGDSPVTAYTVTASPGGQTTAEFQTRDVGGVTYYYAVLSGLTDGSDYTFTVVATNAIADSVPSSPSRIVTVGSRWRVFTPARDASYVLDQQVAMRFEAQDASAIFSNRVRVDGISILFREFDPYDNNCTICDEADLLAGRVFLPTSSPGPHIVTWETADTELNVSTFTRTYFVVDPSDPDADGDGIDDEVDTDPDAPSDSFSDDRTPLPTTGQIIDANGLAVTVHDAADADDGVRVQVTGSGSQEATLEICGLIVTMTTGTDSTETCASLIVEVAAGEVNVELGDGLTVVTVPTGGSAEITEVTEDVFTVENLGTIDVSVTVDGVETTVAGGETQDVTAWDFQGFSAPVDNPDVLNVVRAGQAVPLKWRLVQADGTPVTDLSTASLRVTSRSCSDGTTSDQLEEVAAGSSGLQNLGDGYYQLNWKTPKAYAQSCKTFHLDLGEGVEREALFRFTR